MPVPDLLDDGAEATVGVDLLEQILRGDEALVTSLARAVHLLLTERALSYFEPVAERPGFPAAVARTRDPGVEPVEAAILSQGRFPSCASS